eukprot:gene14371-30596_t
MDNMFPTTKVTRGKVHSYCGMNFDFTEEGKVYISMEGYVKEVLSTYAVVGKAATQATEDLFILSDPSVELRKERAEEFHSKVAKLLFLSKRVRPDICTVICYLSTRVTKSTDEDWNKLDRVLNTHCGVDADAKSHKGVYISIGKGSIYAQSAKQKVLSESSTEAELIGMSD